MLKIIAILICINTLSIITVSAASPADSAEGFWKSIDENGKITAYWKFWVEGEELKGAIVKIPDKPDTEVCTECRDDTEAWKGKSIVGTVWLWGFKKDGEKWTRGKIIDSGKGKLYWASVNVIDGGDAVEVRGSLDRWGFAGRTQVWKRLSDSEVASLGLK
jgi:uncharacterized protein (DUF2147 family)